jgi:hypothetical protein
MDGASPMGGKAAAYGASLELPVVATGYHGSARI